MKIPNRNSAIGLLVASMMVTQISANDNILEISELCRPPNHSGIKRALNFILPEEKRASDSQIHCQQRLNKNSKEAILETKYLINKITDSTFREVQSSIKTITWSGLKSSPSNSEQIYNETSDRDARPALKTLKGYQTVPQ